MLRRGRKRPAPAQAPRWTWPERKLLALSLVVNVEEGAEMSIAEGDRGPEPVDELGVVLKAPIRNYGNESNYRYGLRAGFPRIARLLDDYGAAATWTCAAQALEKAPEIAHYLRDSAHEVCAHGWRWVHQFKFDEGAERAFIRRAVASIEASVGRRPYGWLSRYLHTADTRRLLAEEGFLYHMDDYSDDLPYWDRVGEHGILVLPYQLDTNDMKFWLDPGYTPDQWLQYAIDSLDWLLREAQEQGPRMLSVGLHLRIIGRPGRMHALAQLLEYARQQDGVWIATRLEIARHYAAQHGPAEEVACE